MINKYTLSKGNDKSFVHSRIVITLTRRGTAQYQYGSKPKFLPDYCNRHILNNFQQNLAAEYDNLETNEEEFKLK